MGLPPALSSPANYQSAPHFLSILTPSYRKNALFFLPTLLQLSPSLASSACVMDLTAKNLTQKPFLPPSLSRVCVVFFLIYCLDLSISSLAGEFKAIPSQARMKNSSNLVAFNSQYSLRSLDSIFFTKFQLNSFT